MISFSFSFYWLRPGLNLSKLITDHYKYCSVKIFENTTKVLSMAFTIFLFYRNTEEEKRTFIPLIDYILNVVCRSSLKIFGEKQPGQKRFCIFQEDST